MKPFKSLLAITACWLAVSQAEAQLLPGIKLGMPAYGGTGCPAGTASVTLSPGQDAISVLFDQFTTEAGGFSGRRVDRKNCGISIPVQIPQGYSVAVIQTDFRGFNLIPSGGFNRMDTEYFWAGIRGPRYVRMFNGPQNADYIETNGVMASSLIWTPCGASVNLRINSSIMTQSNAANEQAMMTVDSADISSGMIYHIQWRQCR